MDNPSAGVSDDLARLSLGREYEASGLPPPPSMNRPGVVALDITERFSRAVQTMQPGEVVKDAFFTLLDSVSALEIMDPKMDSGCVNEETEAEESYDVSRPLLPEEVLGIMDQLLCHEMSWHLGYPLSQTLLTGVYVEALSMPDPQDISEATFVRNSSHKHKPDEDPMLQILRAYCLGLLKSCDYVNERIKSEHFYEEEDFVTNTYHRTLLAKIPTSAIRVALTEAVQRINLLRGSTPADLLDALASRLEHRQLFLDAVECTQHIQAPHLAREPWRKALNILPGIEKTHCLGTPVAGAFSVKLQRKLASTMPPRPIIELKFEDAFGHLMSLFRDGLEVIGVLDYTNSQCLMSFVTQFQAKKPQPLVYIRTLLQTFLFDAMEAVETMDIRHILDDDLSIIVLPASPLLDRANDEVEATHDARHAMAQAMGTFRNKAAQPFMDILRTACQNRCRVRRTLCHLIRDWESLQAEAEDIDTAIQALTRERPVMHQASLGGLPTESFSLPLSSWTFLYKVRLMEWIVQLGFELEVYQHDELAGMYWYLNYLAKSRLQHAERIQTFILHQVETSRAKLPRPADPADPAVENQNQNQNQNQQLQRSLNFTRLSLLDAAVTWELSDSLSCLYAVLIRLKLIKVPPRPYSTDEQRYEIRMRPFTAIGHPVVPTFEEFTAGTLQADSEVEELLEYGQRAVSGAKKAFEALFKRSPEESFSVGSDERWTASVKEGRKSCIATGVAIAAVQAALASARDPERPGIRVEIPNPETAYHPWWIVPKIIRT